LLARLSFFPNMEFLSNRECANVSKENKYAIKLLKKLWVQLPSTPPHSSQNALFNPAHLYFMLNEGYNTGK